MLESTRYHKTDRVAQHSICSGYEFDHARQWPATISNHNVTMHSHTTTYTHPYTSTRTLCLLAGSLGRQGGLACRNTGRKQLNASTVGAPITNYKQAQTTTSNHGPSQRHHTHSRRRVWCLSVVSIRGVCAWCLCAVFVRGACA